MRDWDHLRSGGHVLPRWLLLAAVLLGLGLSQATAHFCAAPAAAEAVACAHAVPSGSAVNAAEGKIGPHPAQQAPSIAPGTSPGGDELVVVCLAALGALAAAAVLLLLGPAMAPTRASTPDRPVRLPPSRGSPAFALTLRRTTVLRI
ncbi:hypothetical protein [Nonomuraea sp. NPDC050310]|uniref:hypothetical protein n=1 Tax=Nonomuraea sp. NPDC050310 TaxID=3154935 RepID=UPI0033FA8451